MYKLLLPFLVLGLVACSPSKKSSSNADNPDNADNSETVQRAGQKIAPGHAKVKFSVNGYMSSAADRKVWEVLIHEVVGYGPSTPLLASDVTIKVDATGFLKYADHDSEYYAQKERIDGILEAKGEQVGGDADSPAWNLSRILENE